MSHPIHRFPPVRSRLLHSLRIFSLFTAAFVSGIGAASAADNINDATLQAGTDAQFFGASGTDAVSRGIGVYPRSSADFTGPTMTPDTSGTSRNLAQFRPAYASSAMDYNLTAQLVTDGIVASELPRWFQVKIADGVVKMQPFPFGEVKTGGSLLDKRLRQTFFDDYRRTGFWMKPGQLWTELELAGGAKPYRIDAMEILEDYPPGKDNKPGGGDPKKRAEKAQVAILGSNDGKTWLPIATTLVSKILPGDILQRAIRFKTPAEYRHYRFEFTPADLERNVRDMRLYSGEKRLPLCGPQDFTSSWKSAGNGTEWVSVDLGDGAVFNKVELDWGLPPKKFELQISDDGRQWKSLPPAGDVSGPHQVISLPAEQSARFVRVFMTEPSSPDGYALSEMKVWGRGGFVAHPQPQPPAGDNQIVLTGGQWKLRRSSEVKADGPALSTPGFATPDWLAATVPGTTLSSYQNLDAVPDMLYAGNQFDVSDSYFYDDFWYRDEFTLPANFGKNQKIWLNLEGVNWKADAFLNGTPLGAVNGAYLQGKFDVTGLVKPGQTNAVAIRVRKHNTPGTVFEKNSTDRDLNGGNLGFDSPSFQASQGWDWIPTIRGRCTGLWGNVSLTTSGAVTIGKPFVTTRLNGSTASVSLEVTLQNHTNAPQAGILRGTLAGVPLSKQILLNANSSTVVKFAPETGSKLTLQNPPLWYPNGYGDPALVDLDLKFDTAQGPSDTLKRKVGLREVKWDLEPASQALRLYVNGKHVICWGGNWGFAEALLRYRAADYDAVLKYQRDLHFTIVRNWVGQTADEAFYDACDKYGLMIWDDFWLANPTDGPEPGDHPRLIASAQDKVERTRSHPSVVLYCGRNEFKPPADLDDAFHKIVNALDPQVPYISDSARKPVSGLGPYDIKPVNFYFEKAEPYIHSEVGMPTVPPIESLRRMFPPDKLWPPNELWPLRDYSSRTRNYRKEVEKSFGASTSAEDFARKSQAINYQHYKAIFEAQSKFRNGVLLWMSHPAQPSMTWQVYDYYLEPGGAYFGCKLACEPLHIQWNPLTQAIEVVNNTGRDQPGLTATAEIFNLDGSSQGKKAATLSSPVDSTKAAIQLSFADSLSPVHFIKLTLSQNGKPVSENFYWRSKNEPDYQALNSLPAVTLTTSTTRAQEDSRWSLETSVENPSKTIAFMIRLKAVQEGTSDEILPVIYSDNYFTLLPGEKKVVTTRLDAMDARGKPPGIQIETWNTPPVASPIAP